MHDLNDLYYFAKVVEHGSYAAAGRSVGIAKSKLSRRILALEERLGVRLLQRSTRQLTVTEIGQEFYRHCVAMLVEADAAQEAIERSRSGPQGLVRVSCPPALICFAVGPLIARFMADNPRVTVELESTSRRVDVIGEGIDLAIRVRFPPFEDSDLAMRVLGDSPQRMVCSPSLLAGKAALTSPSDLADLPSVGLGPITRDKMWRLNGPDGAGARIAYTPLLVTDDMSQLLYAAIEGVGVAQLPGIVVDDAIADGSLIELLPGWTPEAGRVEAIFATRRGLLPSVRALIDFLATSYPGAKANKHGVRLRGGHVRV